MIKEFELLYEFIVNEFYKRIPKVTKFFQATYLAPVNADFVTSKAARPQGFLQSHSCGYHDIVNAEEVTFNSGQSIYIDTTHFKDDRAAFREAVPEIERLKR